MSMNDSDSIQPAPPHVSRPRLSERETRVPAALWDRVKFVVLLLGLWACGLAVVWTTTVNPIGGPFSDAVRIAMHDYVWILVLLALEVLRQLNYLIEEHSKAYYRFWQKTVFGGLNHRLSKLDDWTRFRCSAGVQADHLPVLPQLRPGTHLQDRTPSGWACSRLPRGSWRRSRSSSS